MGYERAFSVHGNNDGRTQTDVRKNDALLVHGKNKYRENPNGAAYLISHKVNNNKDTTSSTCNLELPNTKVGQVFFLIEILILIFFLILKW